MAAIEILAPLRIETRFYPPDQNESEWRLRLRVYPDEFSMQRSPAAPSPAELDLLDDVLSAPLRDPPVETEAAFLVFAGKVGPARAVWLMRNVPVAEIDGVSVADRTGVQVRNEEALPTTQKPAGFPPTIGVWLVLPPGQGYFLAGTMVLDRGAIAQDLDLSAFQDETLIRSGELPETWWTSFSRASNVGLAIEIKLGTTPPELEAIVVCGLGDTGPEELIEAHAATGRLAILRPGTPTNTVEGEPTTELGADATAWLPLLSADPTTQQAAQQVIGLLSGFKAPPQPLLGGDIDVEGHGPSIVRALWPVLWGHALRDMLGAGATEAEIADWAFDHLAPEGPYPAIRVGEQPYALLPTTTLLRWSPDNSVEDHLVEWAGAWRQMAAEAAETIGNVVNAPTQRFIELLGESAPTRRWGVRPLAPLAIVRALRAAAGMPTIDPTAWEQASADALAGLASPADPFAPFAGVFPLPPDPLDRMDNPDHLFELIVSLAYFREWDKPLGLLGHLMGETVALLRAGIGQGKQQLSAGQPIDPNAVLPLGLSHSALITLIFSGDDDAVEALRTSGYPGGEELARRFRLGIDSLIHLYDRWKVDEDAVFATLLATLDTAAFRVDPWIMGLANSRLTRLADDGAPFYIGAYGWVDRPRPYTGDPGSPPPPGPTPAGLLHAPSYAQALTSALLRDAAVRYPGDDRWQININSAKVRAAQRLAERVRLGVHPYEALGLEVERLVGNWDDVRILRQHFPLRTTHEGQRCCDGARVLRAILHNSEPVPPDLPAGIAAAIQPLDHVLDTYADLLVTDGVHALVSGQSELANAAMEAAAGLGAPPELRAMHTARGAQTLRVSAWALLPPGVAGGSPAHIADPSFAALLDAELGPPSTWRWTLGTGAAAVSLADRNLHGVDVFDLSPDALALLIRGETAGAPPVVSAGGDEKIISASRLAELFGGGDNNPLVPDPLSGRDDDKAPASSLRQAMLNDLGARFQSLQTDAAALVQDLTTADPADENLARQLIAMLKAWRAFDAGSANPLNAGRAMLAARLKAAQSVTGGIVALRLGIRALVGYPRLPVLPIVSDALLSSLAEVPPGGDGRPATDKDWLEIVAAVRPRLALLEARQLDPTRLPWPAAIQSTDRDPWSKTGPVIVAYGPGVPLRGGQVALAGLDAWSESIPSSEHVTSAAFGFNGPKSRAPQAVLLGVPPDPGQRMTDQELAETVMETRLLARARAARPSTVAGSRAASPSALASPHLGFLSNWWSR
jgi:hypothetical protein